MVQPDPSGVELAAALPSAPPPPLEKDTAPAPKTLSQVRDMGHVFLDEHLGEMYITSTLTCQQRRLKRGDWELTFDDEGYAALLGTALHDGSDDVTFVVGDVDGGLFTKAAFELHGG